MSRHYKFELPYVLGAWKVGFGIRRLQAAGLWDKLPKQLRKKAADANNDWRDLEISKSDCDACSDEVWEQIADELGLEWDPE